MANFHNKIGTIETRILAGFDPVRPNSNPIGRVNRVNPNLEPLEVKVSLALVFILTIGITKTIEYLHNHLVTMFGPNKIPRPRHLPMDPRQDGMNARKITMMAIAEKTAENNKIISIMMIYRRL